MPTRFLCAFGVLLTSLVSLANAGPLDGIFYGEAAVGGTMRSGGQTYIPQGTYNTQGYAAPRPYYQPAPTMAPPSANYNAYGGYVAPPQQNIPLHLNQNLYTSQYHMQPPPPPPAPVYSHPITAPMPTYSARPIIRR